MRRLRVYLTNDSHMPLGFAIGLAVLSGVGYWWLSPPQPRPFIGWIVLVPLLVAIEKRRSREGFFLGWLTGAVVHLVSFPWITGTIQNFSNIPLVGALLCLLLFALYHGLWFALFSSAVVAIRTNRPLWSWAAVPALMVSLERFFPRLFSWNHGATQVSDRLLIQSADLVGIEGISALLLFGNFVVSTCLLAIVYKQPFPKRPVFALLLIVAAAYGYGSFRTTDIRRQLASAPKARIGLVQPNVSMSAKRSHQYDEEIMGRLTEMSRQLCLHGASLIVWPESGAPYSVSTDLVRYQAALAKIGCPVAVGSLAYTRASDGLTNSLFVLDPTAKILGRYDKILLVPFGEYIPLARYAPKLFDWIEGPGNFSEGSSVDAIASGPIRIGPLICYEGIYPDFVGRHVRAGANLLVNITNDAWYGKTRQRYQHLMMVAQSAVVHRRAIVRATNSGISAFVTPLGEIEQPTELDVARKAIAEMPLLETRSLASHFSQPFEWAMSGLSVVLLVGHRRDRIRSIMRLIFSREMRRDPGLITATVGMLVMLGVWIAVRNQRDTSLLVMLATGLQFIALAGTLNDKAQSRRLLTIGAYAAQTLISALFLLLTILSDQLNAWSIAWLVVSCGLMLDCLRRSSH